MNAPQRSSPGLHTSPLQDPGLFSHAVSTDNSRIKFYFYADVLDELAFAASVESGPALAVLTGGFGRLEPFIEISGFAGLSSTEMENAYDSARETVEQCIKNMSIVTGLYVREPNLDAAPSKEAIRLHLSLFNIPAQPLLTHDPVTDNIAAFMRVGSTYVNIPIHIVTAVGDSEE